MKQGMSIQELAQEIARIDSAKKDIVVPTDRMWASVDQNEERNPDREIRIEIPVQETKREAFHNGVMESFGINQIGHGQIANKLEIPKKYYDRMRVDAPELLATNINCWMKQEPKRRLVRTLDGDVRAFLSDRYGLYLDNALLLTSAMPTLMKYEEMSFRSLMLTDKRLYLQCVYPKIQGKLKVGDMVQAGLVLSNSEVGCGEFMCERLIFVLSCLNGCVRGKSLGRRHVSRILGDDPEDFYKDDTIKSEIETFKLMVRDTVENAFDEAEFLKDVKLIDEISDNKIEGKIDKTVEEISKATGIHETEKDEILKRLIEGGDLSQWGMSQSITNLANDVEVYDRAVELQRIGGDVIDMPEDQWRAYSSN